jgi:hypothetical protein
MLSKPISEVAAEYNPDDRCTPSYVRVPACTCLYCYCFHVRRDKMLSKPISEVAAEYNPDDRCTPSYVRVPASYPKVKSSGKTAIGEEVLNDSWVSIISGSEDYSFKVGLGLGAGLMVAGSGLCRVCQGEVLKQLGVHHQRLRRLQLQGGLRIWCRVEGFGIWVCVCQGEVLNDSWVSIISGFEDCSFKVGAGCGAGLVVLASGRVWALLCVLNDSWVSIISGFEDYSFKVGAGCGAGLVFLASGRVWALLCVLNDSWMSIISGSEDYSFKVGAGLWVCRIDHTPRFLFKVSAVRMLQ